MNKGYGWLINCVDPVQECVVMSQEAPFSRIAHLAGQVPSALYSVCELVLYVQPQQVIAALLSPERNLIYCQEFRNTQGISSDMFLRFVFERESLLSESFSSCQIYTSEPLFSLLPEAHFQKEEAYSISRLLLDSAVFKEEVRTMALPSEESHAVFAVSPPLLHLLDHYLPSYQLKHICSISLSLAQHLISHSSFLLLHVLEGQILVTAYKDRQLRLCNLYPFRSLADLIYFVQMVRKVADLEDPGSPIFVLGEIEDKEGNDSSLWEFLPDMQFPPPLLKASSTDLSETAYWRYAFLTF